MVEKEYPYLAKNTVGDKTYVVFFSEENYGMIVMSEIMIIPILLLVQSAISMRTYLRYLTQKFKCQFIIKILNKND